MPKWKVGGNWGKCSATVGKVPHSLLCNCCAFYLFAFCCSLSSLLVARCWCLLLLGPSSSFRVIAFVCFLQAACTPRLHARPRRRIRRIWPLSLVFIFFLYFVRGARVTVTHKGSAKRTRMSCSNPLPHPPPLTLVKGKNLLYLIIIFLLTIRDAYSRNKK